MFQVGDVVWAISARVEAAGKSYRKPKYHVCVCAAERIYFFINSKAKFLGSFRIRHDEFPALANEESYIGCGMALYIPDEEFRRQHHRVVGRLPNDVLVRLLDHVNEVEALTEQERELIIDSLAHAVGY